MGNRAPNEIAAAETPVAAIKRIDREIDANRRLPVSAARSQRESELFCQRGEAQSQRDIQESERAKRAWGRNRLTFKTCVKCGSFLPDHKSLGNSSDALTGGTLA